MFPGQEWACRTSGAMARIRRPSLEEGSAGSDCTSDGIRRTRWRQGGISKATTLNRWNKSARNRPAATSRSSGRLLATISRTRSRIVLFDQGGILTDEQRLRSVHGIHLPGDGDDVAAPTRRGLFFRRSLA
jgi:hypothetical protein